MTDFKANVLRCPIEASAPAAIAGSGKSYSKNVSGVSQEFYETDTGIEYQLTPVTPYVPLTYAHSSALTTTGPRTLINQSAVQNLFPSTRQTATLAASTRYQMRGLIAIGNSTSGTARTVSFSFAGSGWTMTYFARNLRGNSITQATLTQSSHESDTAAASVVSPATDGSRYYNIFVDGFITSTAGGSFTPQISFSVAPGVAFLLDAVSYLELMPLGANTFTAQGGWG